MFSVLFYFITLSMPVPSPVFQGRHCRNNVRESRISLIFIIGSHLVDYIKQN